MRQVVIAKGLERGFAFVFFWGGRRRRRRGRGIEFWGFWGLGLLIGWDM
jgi:hypothetical protein